MARRPKIGYILTPITFGGSERVSLNYLKNADRGSFEILPILLYRPWEEESPFELELKKHDYSCSRIPVARTPGEGYSRVLRCIKNVFSIASRERFDVLHSHGYFADIIATPSSRLLGMAHISTCHGFISTDSKLRLFNRIDRGVLRSCDRIIAVSEKISIDLQKRGIRKEKIVTIPNGVERTRRACPDKELDRRKIRELLGIRDAEKLVGYAGRLSEEKGLEYLIKAGFFLNANGHSRKIVLIGEGPQRKTLRDLAEENGILQHVIFAGFQSEVRSWVRALDVFVLPSLTEGTPLALLEAMTEGVPVVATAVGEVPRIIRDEINGRLVEPGDAKAIAKAVEDLLSNPANGASLASQALKTIEMDFDLDRWRKRIEDQYVSLLTHKKAAKRS